MSMTNAAEAALLDLIFLNTDWANIGDAAEVEAIRGRAGVVEIKDGAFLAIVGRGTNGSLASSVLTGTIETVWS